MGARSAPARRVLGVAESASPAEITRAYRALARRLHPDTGGPTADPARFAEVAEAYATLTAETDGTSARPPADASAGRRRRRPGAVRIPVRQVRRPRG